MAQTLSGGSLIILVLAALLLAIPTLPRVTMPGIGPVLPRADDHAIKHSADAATSEEIHEVMKRGLCIRVERYLSQAHNTILVLCQLDWTALWGGMILGAGTRTELTTFAAPRAWWDNVIVRDGYVVAAP
jgi:hypothetical protein